MITLDVRNKLVEIHLVSASGRHEGGSARNLAVFMICTCSLGFKGDGEKSLYPRSAVGRLLLL